MRHLGPVEFFLSKMFIYSKLKVSADRPSYGPFNNIECTRKEFLLSQWMLFITKACSDMETNLIG